MGGPGKLGFLDKRFASNQELALPSDLDVGLTKSHIRNLVLANQAGDFGFEVNLWAATLAYPGANSGTFVKNLFKLLKYGRLQFRKDKGNNWQFWPHALAIAISHGGRILFQLPVAVDVFGVKERDFRFIEWMTGKTVDQLYQRSVATHEIDRLSEKDIERPLANGGQKVLKEVKPKFKFSSKGTKHFGINLALGGSGRRSPHVHKGTTLVAEDGRHGHAYVLFKPPSANKVGGMLIGIEGSEAKKWDMLGHFHGASASSSELSMSGGLKFKSLKRNDMPNGDDCMIVDLLGFRSIDLLISTMEAQSDVNATDHVTSNVMADANWIKSHTFLPSFDLWEKKWSYKSVGSRSTRLEHLGTLLDLYHQVARADLPKRMRYLDALWWNCEELQRKNERKSAVERLMDLIAVEAVCIRTINMTYMNQLEQDSGLRAYLDEN